jgi:uncharacterized protein
MIYFSRSIDIELEKWKNDKSRKPILLRGARQVGKTQSVRHLGQKFDFYIEINFESDKRIHSLFTGDLATEEIVRNISAVYNIPVKPGQTLLFFDEIQACIPAIQTLRFLYEQIPGLHVIAAGSLLEFSLSDMPSFGVGRIRSLFMYPFSFDEFLKACNEDELLAMKQQAIPVQPLTTVLHEKLLNYLKVFMIIGGMPESVAKYISNNDLRESNLVINDLRISYFDDFAKYKERVPAQRLRDVYNSVVMQTGNKFVYSKIESGDNQKQVKEALELLILAGVVIPVTHTSANGLPLGAEAKSNWRKMILLDTALLLNTLNLDIGEVILSEDYRTINKGSLTEMFVGLELMKYSSPYQRNALYYWHREARNSNAEVDYLIVKGNSIIPLEVKSGSRGAMQSMNLFIQAKGSEKGIRISQENFSKYNNIEVFPLYAISNI